MVDSRLSLAQRLALIAAIIVVVYHVDELMKATGSPGFVPMPDNTLRVSLFGLPALALSAAAFALAGKQTTIIVPVLLVIPGGLMTVDSIAIGTEYLSVLTMPGPTLGIIYGGAMLALGITKAAQTAIVLKQPPAAKKGNQ